MGTILTVVAHLVTDLKLENAVIDFYGPGIVVAPSFVYYPVTPYELVAVMTPTGTRLIHQFSEEVKKSLAHLIPDMQCVWSMTSHCRQTATEQEWTLTISLADQKTCAHGEPETILHF